MLLDQGSTRCVMSPSLTRGYQRRLDVSDDDVGVSHPNH